MRTNSIDDSEIVKEKVERKSLALKDKKESSDEECLTSESEDEDYAMAVETFMKSGVNSGEEDDEKVNNETCLVAQASSEMRHGVDLEPDEWIKDSGCSKHMTGNRKLFSSYKAYNEGNVIFGSNLHGNFHWPKSNFFEHDSEITKDGKVIEPKNVNEALTDDSWIVAMQEELNQFIANDVWELVPQPRNMTIIGTKWVFRNKLDENGIVSRNKARLVAQGYNQQEGIDYDETYAPVARLESIRILLAYACALDFKLFQMDVKSAFLNGFINEEVYVAQPPGFIDFEKPDHVYKLKKALYGLKQAPKACFVEFECLLEISDQIYHRFILEFYSQYQINYSDEGEMFIEFVIQNQFFSYSLEEFAQILDIPCEDGPYQTNPPSPDDIILSIRIDREGQVRHIRHKEEIDALEYQVLTHEIEPTMKPLEEIIQENIFCLVGNRDHVPACLCYMLYCVVHSEKFNLAC
ncbi:retrovirus-related pol polyprotein from transposon TNT 1-94 [Tanacetum coccineum]